MLQMSTLLLQKIILRLCRVPLSIAALNTSLRVLPALHAIAVAETRAATGWLQRKNATHLPVSTHTKNWPLPPLLQGIAVALQLEPLPVYGGMPVEFESLCPMLPQL